MEILGHRGWPEHGENTLPAVLAALAAGADGVEVDVRLTADGVAACVHDADLARVGGLALEVATTEYAALTRVPLGLLAGLDARVPRVEEVAAVVSGRGRLVLDLKPSALPLALVAAAVTAVRVAGLHPADVVLSSFDAGVLDACAVVAPWLERAVIAEPSRDVDDVAVEAVARGDRAVHLPLVSVLAQPDAVRTARRRGLMVRAWTVNRVVDARLLDLLDVGAVITDEPAALVGGLRAVAAG